MRPKNSAALLERLFAGDVSDDVLRAMGERQCRYTLYYLLDNGTVSLDDLTDVLAGWIAATDRRVTTALDHHSLRISLFHTYLPKLSDSGLVDFDPEQETVDRTRWYESTRNLIEAAYLTEHRTEDPPDR